MNPTTVAIGLVIIGYLAALVLIVLGLTRPSGHSATDEKMSAEQRADLDRDDRLRHVSYRIAVAMVYVGVLVLAFYPASVLAMGAQAAVADAMRWQRVTSDEPENATRGIVLASVGIAAIVVAATVGVRAIAKHFAVRLLPTLLIGAGLVLLGLLTMLVWVVVAAPAAN